jgi:hypothetical protein
MTKFVKGQKSWNAGKSWEEIYGFEKTEKLKKEKGDRTRGKTFEEIYGVEKANEIRKKMKENLHDQYGRNNSMYGKTSKRKGKTLERVFGIEKAMIWKKNLSKSHIGNIPSEDTRKKIGFGNLGKITGTKGKTYDELYGLEKAKKIRKKQSESNPRLSGEKNPAYGRPSHRRNKTLEQEYGFEKAQKIKERMSISNKQRWMDEEYAKKLIASFQLKPNIPELYLDFILQNHFPNEWKYVGDGQIVIDGLCPDFINVNGKKLIIEVFGEYWHKNKKDMKYRCTENGRREAFSKYEYSTLIVWENEFIDESKIIEKIHVFMQDAEKEVLKR